MIDEVNRLIIDTHSAAAFQPVSHLTVGDFRNRLLSDAANTQSLAGPGCSPITPPMTWRTSPPDYFT